MKNRAITKAVAEGQLYVFKAVAMRLKPADHLMVRTDFDLSGKKARNADELPGQNNRPKLSTSAASAREPCLGERGKIPNPWMEHR